MILRKKVLAMCPGAYVCKRQPHAWFGKLPGRYLIWADTCHAAWNALYDDLQIAMIERLSE